METYTKIKDVIDTYKIQVIHKKNIDGSSLTIDSKGIAIYNSTITNNIFIPDDIVVLLIVNTTLDNVDISFKRFTSLMYLFIDNIKINVNSNIYLDEIYYLGNLQLLYTNNIPNFPSLNYVESTKMLKFFNKGVQIKSLPENFYIGGIFNITCIEFKGKKIMFCSDDHYKSGICKSEFSTEFSQIEFFYNLYLSFPDLKFLFEQKTDIITQTHFEQMYSPTISPFPIIGTSKWFSNLDDSRIFNIDNRWEEQFYDTQHLVQTLASKKDNVSNDLKHEKFLHFCGVYELYVHFLQYTENQNLLLIDKYINPIHKNLIEQWKQWCHSIYSYLYHTYNSIYEDLKTGQISFDTINTQEMFLYPTALYVDTLMLSYLSTPSFNKICINIGYAHTVNMLRFLQKLDSVNYTELFNIDNFEPNSKISCLQFEYKLLMKFI